jgi:NAD(P)-dependent dehydrogenase (short-subunit alcohol dehydrogenase family)
MGSFSSIARPRDGAAWVTGASRGIGRAVALKLAERGWTVYVSARSEADLKAVAAEHASIHPLPCDVTDSASVEAAVRTITAERPIALALLNAGIYQPMRASNFDAEAARKMLDVNLGGTVTCLDPVLKHMLAQKQGHIALTASVAGYRGLPDAAVYSGTKAAMIAMAEALAMDLSSGPVRISVINPGFVDTDATAVNSFEMPFLMQPEEAARRIVQGLERPGFEIAFPRRFAAILRLIGLLPNRAYIWTVRKLTGWDRLQG